MKLSLAGLAVAGVALAAAAAAGTGADAPAARPLIGEYAQITTSHAPPSEAQCESAGRRCFTPQALQSAYDVAPLYADGDDGRGQTIAVIDSYGNPTMAHDLHVYDQAFGLQAMCGEEDVACAAGMPAFGELDYGGPPKGGGDGARSAWALETALDVEAAHAIAPQANILLVATPVDETSGRQGMPELMDAEQYVIDHHLATVISQSFGTTEESLGQQSLAGLRHAFTSAQAAGISVLASSGDSGTANAGEGSPTVEWPASDPLVTAVGGTSLCTDPRADAGAARGYAAGAPTSECGGGDPESGWTGSGGGFSHVFGVPPWQAALPAGSTAIASGRGVPDIALQASAATGDLIYISLAPDGDGGLMCGGTPCSSGWYDVGGTSLASPQWAGLVALADQLNGGGLGLLNPALYAIGADPSRYARDFYDITTGDNAASRTVPGYPAGPGWDPVTGLGTPNAANLVPDLVAAVHQSEL
jgi:subtilase family serine protease